MTGKPTIVQLEYIVAVDNFRHFATAAEKCFVTQPTLSMQIQKLEEQLGITIFDRSKHPVVPTLSGQRVLKQARRVLHEAYLINDIVGEEHDEVRGELRIGIIPTIAPYLLPRFISSFISRFPEVHIHIEEQITDRIIEMLKKEILDVGIIVTPLNDKGLFEMPLYYEEFLVYVSKESGVSEMDKVAIKDLKNEKIWVLDEGHCFRDQVISICDLQNISKDGSKFSYRSGSLESVKKLVDVYGGVTLLPELAEIDLNPTDVENIKPLMKPVPTREVSLVTHRNYIKKKIIDGFKKEILAGLPDTIKKRKSKNKVGWR